MPKKITRAQRLGKIGELIVEETVTAVGFTYHPAGDLEAGTDGFIELNHSDHGGPTGHYIAVQVKTTGKQSLVYDVRRNDLEYWKRQNLPFVLLLVFESERRVLWQLVDHSTMPGAVRFSRTNVLDKSAAATLRRLVEIWRWISQLQADDSRIRLHAAGVLGDLGPGAALAVPSLCASLKDAGADVRERAAAALGLIGDTSQTVAFSLLRSSTDESHAVVRASVDALQRLGEPMRDHLIAGMQGRDVRLAVRAAYLGAHLGLAREEGIQALGRFLSRRYDTECRKTAACGLRINSIGHPGLTFNQLPQIIAALRDEDAGVRQDCAWAVGIIGTRARCAGDDLLVLLDDKIPEVRSGAAKAVGSIGHATPTVASGLISLLENEDEPYFVRAEAAEAIGLLFPDHDRASCALRSALSAGRGSVRQAAAAALRHSTANARCARTELIAALKDEHHYVRKEAAATLGTLSPDAGILAALIAALDDEYSVAAEAASSLGRFGSDARPALDKLRSIPISTGSWGGPSVFQVAITRIEEGSQ